MFNGYRVYCFTVPTAAGTVYTKNPQRGGPVMCGWDTGTITGETGLPQRAEEAIANNRDMDADMKARLTRLLVAIEESVLLDNTFSQGNALDKHIFVAPEFYFRPPKNTDEACGEYTYAQYIALSNFLGDYFARFNYFHEDQCPINNWLFLCGTCVFNIHSGDPGTRKMLWNVMLAYTVDATGTMSAQHFRKLCTSHIDGIVLEDDINWEQQTALCLLDYGELNDHYFPSFHVFVEICLETSRGLWKNEWQGGAVEAHVISAAGMPMEDITNKVGSTAVRIRNDGMLDKEDEMTSFSFEGPAGTEQLIEIRGWNYQWSGKDLQDKARKKGLTVFKESELINFSPFVVVVQ